MIKVSAVKDRKGFFSIYDNRGDLVGQVSTETGRALIGGAFYVKERTYHPERVSTAYHSSIECSECKYPLDEVTIYCPHCGARLEGVGR